MTVSRKLEALKKLENSLQKEIKEIDVRKQELESQLALLNELKSVSLIGAEGDTISYKLGKVLLSTKSLKDILLLPRRLMEVRRFSKRKLAFKELESEPNRNTIAESIIQKAPVTYTGDTNLFSSVLTLSDNLNYLVYQNSFPAYYLTENYQAQLNNTKAKFMLIDSTQIGVKGYWKYALLSNMTVHGKMLLEACNILKEKNIPIVFIYKSSKSELEKFSEFFKVADYVFFEDQTLLDRVRHQKILKSPINLISPSISNKIINYANSLIVDNTQKDNLLYLSLNSNFFSNTKKKIVNTIIADDLKNVDLLEIEKFESDIGRSNAFKIKLPLEYTEQDLIQNIKKYKFTLYIPDIEDNFVPREILFSLMAGVPVITLENESLENIFGDALIYASSSHDIMAIQQRYLNDKWEYLRKIKIGNRLIRDKFSEVDFKNILLREVAKQDTVDSGAKPLVSIIMASMREHYIDRIITNIQRQNYENIEFIIITQNFTEEGVNALTLKLEKLKNLVRYKVVENNSEDTLGERQNQAASFAQGEYIAKFDDDDFYFSNYLSDAISAFSLGNYDLVGKAEFFIYLEALDQTVLIRDGKAGNREMDFVSGATFVIRKNKFDQLGGFVSVNQSEDSNLLKRLKESGGKIYSSDPFNFIVFRSANVTDHTWQQKAEAFAKSCTLVSTGFADNIVNI